MTMDDAQRRESIRVMNIESSISRTLDLVIMGSDHGKISQHIGEFIAALRTQGMNIAKLDLRAVKQAGIDLASARNELILQDADGSAWNQDAAVGLLGQYLANVGVNADDAETNAALRRFVAQSWPRQKS